MTSRTLWAGLVSVLLAAGAAMGQDDARKQDGDKKRGQDRKRQARGAFGLPNLKTLTEKLELSEEVAAKVGEILKKGDEDFAKLRKSLREGGGDRQSMRKKFMEGRAALIKAIAACLNEEQKKTFEELVKTKRKRGADRKKTDQNNGGDRKKSDDPKKDS